jgi:alpha-glucosidase
MWWRDAVVYQVYPSSFQDSDGDGVGDLRGVAARLDHVERLGARALWLSPVYPSPFADGGYDVSDYESVDPRYGTQRDLDALIAAAHGRDLAVLMDLVPCHTSIEHPWFREHPDWYVWSDRDGPQNNWVAAFGGPAWSRDERTGGWYLHSFYPEQPDLDWRNPAVVEAMSGVVRLWLERGVDGFRLDALDRLMKDPELRDDPPAHAPLALPEIGASATFEHVHSRNAPDIGTALAALRAAAADALLVGEVYLPTAQLGPYLEHLDVAFCFELLHAPFEALALRTAIEAALAPHPQPGKAAWVLSNHDFRRLPDRVGPGNERAAALLLLTLPGTAFVYQGDEIGMTDGPGADPPIDRAGRDRHRHPMQWSPEPLGGFTTGEPWLPLVDPAQRSVADQDADRGSLLWLYRELIALRPRLGEGLRFLDCAPDVLAYERGEHVVAINVSNEPRPAPAAGAVVLSTHGDPAPGERPPAKLAPRSGFVAAARG